MESQNPLVIKEQNMPSAPGIGVAGMVLCPLKQFPQACIKQGCEWWVELNYGDKVVGRCGMAWLTIVNVELRQELERVRHALVVPDINPPLSDKA